MLSLKYLYINLQFYYDVSENEIWLGEQEIFLTIDDLGKVHIALLYIVACTELHIN